MAVTVGEICDLLERLAPEALAEEWDNVGLLVGRRGAEVGKILVALDVTGEVISEAVSAGAGMIVSHHPVIFKPVSSVNDETPQGRRLLELIENKIAVYSAHTNLDIAKGGTNDTLAEELGLLEIEGIIFDDKGENYIGRAGRLEQPMELRRLAGLVKEKLSLETARFVGNGSSIVGKAGICTGSGAKYSYFRQVKDAGCDVYITGDISYHQAQEALDCGLCLIDATHYASEAVVVGRLCNYLKDGLGKDIEIIHSKVDGQVFGNI